MEKDVNFFYLLDEGLRKKRYRCTTLSRILEESNVSITPRSIQRYKAREILPQLNTAIAILKALDYKLTKIEVEQCLKNAVFLKHDSRYANSRYIERSVRLRISKLSNTLSNDAQIQMALSKRMKETQGSEFANFNHYVTLLIRTDIDNKILPRIRKKNK